MNAVVLVPDGVGVRNIVLGSLLRQTSEWGDVRLLHVTIPDNLLETYSYRSNGRVRWEPLLAFRESSLSFTLRYCLAYAQMYWADTRSMRYIRTRPMTGSWRTRAVHRAAGLVGRLAASPGGIKFLDRWHRREVGRLPEVEHYRRLFREERPSVLLCSHHRPPRILPPVLAAKSLGIPTATFIFSWDNLTSKGRIAAPFDHYLVWSDLMRRELLRYYPDVSADRVHLVGAPQFDPYADEGLMWSREEFCRRIGADPARPLICYSGGDAGTCPEDPEHARMLVELVRAGRIRGNPQVMLRPSPVDDGSRYDSVRRDYPELIYARPAWVHTDPGDWSRVIPLLEDVQFLANLTQHADLNVNTASTMTLDFAIRDTPVVNVAFDVADPPPFGVPLWDFFYRFEHYRPVVELGAARFALDGGAGPARQRVPRRPRPGPRGASEARRARGGSSRRSSRAGASSKSSTGSRDNLCIFVIYATNIPRASTGGSAASPRPSRGRWWPGGTRRRSWGCIRPGSGAWNAIAGSGSSAWRTRRSRAPDSCTMGCGFGEPWVGSIGSRGSTSWKARNRAWRWSRGPSPPPRSSGCTAGTTFSP